MRISPFKNHITPLSSPSLLKKPCFGNSEEAERGDNNNKTLAIATGIATLVTIGGIAYLCKTPTTSKNNLKGIDTSRFKIKIVEVSKVEEAFRVLFS